MSKKTHRKVSDRILQILSKNGQQVIPDGSGWVRLDGRKSEKHETRLAAIIAGCQSLVVNRQPQLFN